MLLQNTIKTNHKKEPIPLEDKGPIESDTEGAKDIKLTTPITNEIQDKQKLKVKRPTAERLAPEVIAASLPKAWRNKTLEFLNTILNHSKPVINWNNKGQFIYKKRLHSKQWVVFCVDSGLSNLT